MTAILAMDQGTTSTKAFLLHSDGRFQSVGALRHETFHPSEGLVEQDAAEILRNIETLIDAAIATRADLIGICLANQGETVVAWDRATGQPLHRAIVWQDQRTKDWLEALDPASKADVEARSGLPVDPYFSASKLRWLIDHVDACHAARVTGTLGLSTSDAYFIERLTGAYATDVTTASRTALMGLETLEWDERLSGLFGVPLDVLPEIRRTTGSFGIVRRGSAAIPLVASIVDQQAALYGHGCRQEGDLKVTFGTGTFALALTGHSAHRGASGFVPTVAWQMGDGHPVYAIDGGDYTAAAAIDWAIGIGLAAKPDSFDAGAGASALERGLVFVPALAGLAAPHWDRDAAGAFLGLRQSTGAADMRRAVLEGVALRAVELVEALAPHSSSPVSIDGGLTHNAGFVQFFADALGRTVLLRDHSDLTALGAAELGFAALGLPVPPRDGALDRRVEPSAASPRLKALLPVFAAALASVRAFGRITCETTDQMTYGRIAGLCGTMRDLAHKDTQ